MSKDNKTKIGNNEAFNNMIESSYRLGIGGSIGINGEILIKNSIPKEPLEGDCMLWYSDGNDTTFSNSDPYVDNTTTKLSRGLYIAYKPQEGQTQYTRITDLSNNTNWSNPYIDKSIDNNNILHCTFKNTDTYGFIDNITFPFRLKNSSGVTLQDGIHWVSGLGELELVGKNPINFYELKII